MANGETAIFNQLSRASASRSWYTASPAEVSVLRVLLAELQTLRRERDELYDLTRRALHVADQLIKERDDHSR